MQKLFFLLALACMQVATAQKKAKAADRRLAGLDSACTRALSVWKGPGFAIAIVDKNRIVYSRGFGYRNQERRLPVTPNTLFAIGSCTKAFTAAMIGRLAAQGKLDLDKPVQNYFPELRFFNQQMNDRITLRDMMCHRTGLPRHDYSWYFFRSNSRDSLVSRIRYLEPNADIGDKWQYNNFMFMAQGALIEKITGKSWENNLRSAFFEPLGMRRSNFSTADLIRDEDAATGYFIRDSAKKEWVRKMDYFPIDAMGPAGSINSSVTEMAAWLQTWIRGGKSGDREIIPAAYATDAISSQMIIGSGLPEKELKDVYFSTYGLGWTLNSYRGHYRVEHGGNIDGFSASVCFFPTDSIGIVVLCNQNNSMIPAVVRNLAADHLLGLKYRDWNAVMKSRQNSEPESDDSIETETLIVARPKTKPIHPLKDYEGLFNNPGYGTLQVRSSGDSLFMDIGKKTWWMKPTQYDWFRVIEKDADEGIDTADHGLQGGFRTAADGSVNELDLPFEPTIKPIPFIRIPQAAALRPE